MPKLKTHSGTKDRVKVSKNGKIRARRSNANHFLQKKSGSRKRRISSFQTLDGANAKTIKTRLGV
jgi:large subunit ribosomal protein L35